MKITKISTTNQLNMGEKSVLKLTLTVSVTVTNDCRQGYKESNRIKSKLVKACNQVHLSGLCKTSDETLPVSPH